MSISEILYFGMQFFVRGEGVSVFMRTLIQLRDVLERTPSVPCSVQYITSLDSLKTFCFTQELNL